MTMLERLRRGTGRQLFAAFVVVLVAGGAVAPALAGSGTATWNGTVHLTGSPAENGTTYQYELNDPSAVSNLSVEMTGVTSSEWDNESATVSPGSSMGVSLAGDSVSGPSSGTPTISITPTEESLSNPVDPTSHPGSGSTGQAVVAGRYGGLIGSEMLLESPPDTVNGVTLTIATSAAATARVDVYISQEETVDTTHGEGTLVASNVTVPTSTGEWTIPFNQSVSMGSGNATVEFVTTYVEGSSDHRWYFSDHKGTTTGYSWNGYTYDGWADLTLYSPGISNLTVTADTGATASFTNVTGGETVTKALNVTTETSALSWDGADGAEATATLHVQEQTQTTDPGILLNGHETRYTGTLNDGETVTLSPNES